MYSGGHRIWWSFVRSIGERFMMVSTDKAVNPTNVMGATKRMRDDRSQSASTMWKANTVRLVLKMYLGSADQLFHYLNARSLMATGYSYRIKRINGRYFMTIPKHHSLFFRSGAIANNGETVCSYMGQPVKIGGSGREYDRLSGVQGIEIVETGLQTCEKLYEELLVKTEELDKQITV